MAKKSVGYVELEWTCKRCGTKNPGTEKSCINCGAPMGADEEFVLPAQQKIIEDEAKLGKVGKGADTHCPYCGTRNPAAAESCIQCGGDLREGAVRRKGKILGAHSQAPVPEQPCPYCNQPNPETASRCGNCGGDLRKTAVPKATESATRAKPKRGLAILGAVLGILCLCAVAAFFIFAAQTSEMVGVVSRVEWERSVAIQEFHPVERQDWRDQIPNEGEILACQQELRDTSSVYVPGAEEVCGEPYVVDQGDGVGEVVQDCTYYLYDDMCRYAIEEWADVDLVTVRGADLSPYWPALNLGGYQREGNRSETYTVEFLADGQTYTFHPDSEFSFTHYVPGSQWTLTLNGLGNLVEVGP
ncbi:MAG: zinc ribbon domain-containing protein [Anaerolineales bacterium]|nr:zinc ribbon domain-containing protein [Anaerolineales bacterium]